MKIFVSEQEKEFLDKTFRKFNHEFNVFVFGSRARGDHKKYSDLDICLKGPEKIDPNIISQLKNIFEESNIPYTVDIVDWNNISNDFQNKIKPDMVPLPF